MMILVSAFPLRIFSDFKSRSTPLPAISPRCPRTLCPSHCPNSSGLTLSHFWLYQHLCERDLFSSYTVNNLSYLKTFFLLLGQGRLGMDSEMFLLAQLMGHVKCIFMSEQTHTIPSVSPFLLNSTNLL